MMQDYQHTIKIYTWYQFTDLTILKGASALTPMNPWENQRGWGGGGYPKEKLMSTRGSCNS